jgi:hypothetical protein
MFGAVDIAIAGDGQRDLVHCVVFQDTRAMIRESIIHTLRAKSTFEEFRLQGDNFV